MIGGSNIDQRDLPAMDKRRVYVSGYGTVHS